jgi:menaquinone-dependent protoporphyrinogen oxidase
MPDRILVTFATRYGSTQEVAERVAGLLRREGLEVDLKPAREVQSLEGYGAVVLGAPLYIGHWLKDARRFFSRHRDALTARPVALFTLGPTRDGEHDWQEVRSQLDQELADHAWLTPVSTALFGGKYDPDKLRFPDSLLAKLPASPLHGLPPNDMRSWVEIDAWASRLPAKLKPDSAH